MREVVHTEDSGGGGKQSFPSIMHQFCSNNAFFSASLLFTSFFKLLLIPEIVIIFNRISAWCCS